MPVGHRQMSQVGIQGRRIQIMAQQLQAVCQEQGIDTLLLTGQRRRVGGAQKNRQREWVDVLALQEQALGGIGRLAPSIRLGTAAHGGLLNALQVLAHRLLGSENQCQRQH